jgi:hypothetical protein
MKKFLKRIASSFLVILSYPFLYHNNISAKDLVHGDEPARLYDARDIFVNVLIALWAIAIPYFMYNVMYIGGQWMLSQGDQTKLTQVKQRGGRIFLSAFLVFGGYLIVRLLMILLDLNRPETCFDTPFRDVPMFEFFYPKVCD